MKQVAWFFLVSSLIFSGCSKSSLSSSGSSTKVLRIFVSERTSNGNIGGVSNADAKCMTSDNYPGSGTFKALIGHSSQRLACDVSEDCSTSEVGRIDWPLKKNTPYYRLDGVTRIATTNALGLFEFDLAASISDDSAAVWTGLNSDFSINTGFNCTDWSDSGGAPSQGVTGESDSVEDISFDSNSTECSDTAHFYCVEQ